MIAFDRPCPPSKTATIPPPGTERAVQAIPWTIKTFRGEPNHIGRARMFAEPSVDPGDPGMSAFCHMLDSLRPG
ncbi:hypothetical protein [Azospirillum sp. B506]|uniref:hypothetical protein n=1 Tax=Azospirillum sp. B506 TaxID=137721 RepID=UPI00131EE264|nr:hypothetical protein [Azospirillum sp. B506]